MDEEEYKEYLELGEADLHPTKDAEIDSYGVTPPDHDESIFEKGFA